MNDRVKVWNKLAHDWKPGQLANICHEITLEEVSHHIELILQGKLKGRTILSIAKS